MSISSDLAFSSAIDSIYDSTLDSSLWESTLKLTGRVSDSLGNHFLIFDSSFTPQFGAIHSTYGQNFALQAHQAYMNDYAHIDHQRVTRFLKKSDGKAHRNQNLMDSNELKKDLVHNVYNQEFECQKQLLYANKLGSSFLTVCGSRPGDAKRYSPTDLYLFEQLAGHITKSIGMQLRYGELFGPSTNLKEIINSERHSVFFLDKDFRLLWCNDTGEKLLDKKTGLYVQLGQLNSKDPHFNDSLFANWSASTEKNRRRGEATTL